MTPDDDPDLSELRRALDRATPRPDPATRAAHLRLAQGNFDRLHAAPARRGARGRLRGLLASFAHPGAATGATAVAALALLMVTPTGQGILRAPLSVGEADRPLPPGAETKEAPEAAPLAVEPAAPASDSMASQAADEAVAAAPEAGVAARSAGPAPGTPEAAPEVLTAPAASALAEAAPASPGGARDSAGPSLGDMAALAPQALPEAAADAAAGAEVGAASLAAVREAMLAGLQPPPEAVDVQGLVDRLAPVPAAPVPSGAAPAAAVSVIPAPWDPSARLVVVTVRAGGPVEGAELELDGAAALGAAGGAVPLGALSAGGSAVRVLEAAPGAALPGPLRLRWTDPASGRRREAKAPVTGVEPATPEALLAAAVAGWALLLREGQGRLGDWGHAEAAALAEAAGGRALALDLLRRTERLAP